MPSHGALADIRVLDVTQVMAGPYCAMLLCDMGADVIKVEPPAGDSSRRMAGASGADSPSFNAVNRGKRGVVIDLKSAEGRGVLERLATSADVLVENFRPGVMAKLGLGYPRLAHLNPRLVYASISGYGQTGPKASRGGFDLVAQGVSGIISVTGELGRAPVKAGVPITDLGAALFAVSGILAALHYRDARTGRGQHIDTSLVEAGVALSVWEATEYFSDGGVPGPLGSAHRMSAPYQAIRCADGHITLGGANDRIFRRVCDLLGHASWADDPDYADDTARVRNRAVLARQIEAITETQSCRHWLDLFDAHDIPCGPINDYAAVVRDPQIQAREMVVETEHPTLGTIKTLGSPIKLSETPVTPARPAPLLGQHTDAVLREAGYDDAEIARLRDAKVVK
ncbi:MAG: CoA transferase [Acidobacteria bacterium]|nr:CoA transferase [Acidobacteriota bacterium]|tara:strand:+ start:3754 stop:4947 length:1194 start_codon:yes stop_codon:yes gene_type:complete